MMNEIHNNNDGFKSTDFSLIDTYIHKGFALLLLLGIHVFVRSDFSLYHYGSLVENRPFLNYFFYNTKICVTIFVFLSGYGLNKSYKKSNTHYIPFVYKHLLKLMTNFWFVFISFSLIGFITGKISFISVWGTGKKGVVSFVVDFLGLQDIITDFVITPTLNPTWWFMGTIIILYLLFPVIKLFMRINLLFPSIIGICLNFYAQYSSYKQVKYGWLFYFASFCVGIFCAEKDIINKYRLFIKKFDKHIHSASLLYFIICLSVPLSFYLRTVNRFRWDLLNAFCVFVFVDSILIRFGGKAVRSVLYFLGKHSSNIFMLHTFFVSIYWQDVIYYTHIPVVCYLSVLVLSLASSILIECIKKYLHYDSVQLKISQNYTEKMCIPFDKEQSQKIKGVAIMLLLFHHLFYSLVRINDGGGIKLNLISLNHLTVVATLARVCVWMFVFVTSYGLSKKYRQIIATGSSRLEFVISRWLLLMKQYWLIFVLSFVFLCISGNSCIYTLCSKWYYLLFCFLGISDITGTPMPVAAWWYISLAQIIIILLPFIVELCNKYGYLVLLVSFVFVPYIKNWIISPYGGDYLNYIYIIIIGVLVSQYNLMEKFSQRRTTSFLQWAFEVAILTLLIIGCLLINYYYGKNDDLKITKILLSFAAFLLCFLVYKYFNQKYIRRILVYIGAHSGNIFLIHAFGYTFYNKYVFYSHNLFLTFFSLLFVSLMLSQICKVIKRSLQL